MNEAQSIREIVGRQTFYSEVCTVESVDDYTCTCISVLNPTLKYEDVRIKAHSAGDLSIITKPTVGSFVILNFITTADAYIALYDEIDEVNIMIGDQTLKATKDGFIFNGGGYGGLIKIEKLVDELNAIKDAHNNFLTEYKTHIHSLNLGGLVTIVLTPPSVQQNIQKTQLDPLEDQKIKH